MATRQHAAPLTAKVSPCLRVELSGDPAAGGCVAGHAPGRSYTRPAGGSQAVVGVGTLLDRHIDSEDSNVVGRGQEGERGA